MKKVALLLGALSLVSSVAYAKEVVPAVEEVVVVEEAPVAAAPALRVTNFGQFIEVDNTAGGEDIGEGVWFGNKLGLAYGDDWSFGITAAKIWSMDTDNGIHSADHRLEMDAWRHFENVDLGLRYRGQSDFDRYYLRGAYHYGMLSGSADVWYHAVNKNVNGQQDNYEMELIPVKLTYGPFGIGYFFNYKEGVGNTEKTEFDHYMEHQIRAYANFDLTEKLSTYAEYRVTLGAEQEQYGKEFDLYDAGDYHKIEVGASYALTENLSLYGYYAYELGNITEEAERLHNKDVKDKRYGEFTIGWDYQF